MKTRYSGKSFKDSSTMKKAKLSIRGKRKIKREKKKSKAQQKIKNFSEINLYTCTDSTLILVQDLGILGLGLLLE